MSNITNMGFYGYDETKGDFTWYPSFEIWERRLTAKGAGDYVQNHVLQSLIKDFNPAFTEYKKRGSIGFFALLRMIFPYISFMGSLYSGIDKTADVIHYIHDYLGKVDAKYEKYGDIMYWSYRHGLIHTNMPASFEIDDIQVGWLIFLEGDHLELSSPILFTMTFTISCKTLFDDVCKSIDDYMADLRNDESNLLENFKKGYKIMAMTYDEVDVTPCDIGIQNIKSHIIEQEKTSETQKYYSEG